MNVEFVEARYKGKVRFDKLREFLKGLKFENVFVFSSVQFVSFVSEFIGSLRDPRVRITKPARAKWSGQILGCDSYFEDLRVDVVPDYFVYIGDGNFHPYALLFAQERLSKRVPVVIYNPISEQLRVVEVDSIERYLKKRKGNLMRFYDSNRIGVFVSTKPGQMYYKVKDFLLKKFPEKSFYFFMGDLFSPQEIENFPFVECWVNTACPRIGQDDVFEFSKPVVNLRDLL